MIVGRLDGRGRLRVAGRTSILAPAERRELAAVLTLPSAQHPWPATLLSSRFGQLPAEPVSYTQVRPDVVVEIDADTAHEHDRWRHPTVFWRIRAGEDVRPTFRLQTLVDGHRIRRRPSIKAFSP